MERTNVIRLVEYPYPNPKYSPYNTEIKILNFEWNNALDVGKKWDNFEWGDKKPNWPIPKVNHCIGIRSDSLNPEGVHNIFLEWDNPRTMNPWHLGFILP